MLRLTKILVIYRLTVDFCTLSENSVGGDRNMLKFLEHEKRISQESISVYHHPTAVAKTIFFYLYGAGNTVVNRFFFVTKNDCNNGFLVLCSVAGSGILKYRDQEHIVSPNTALFIDCTELWSLHYVKGECWNFVWIHFDGQNSLGYYRQYTKRHNYNLITLDEDSVLIASIREIIERHICPDNILECKSSHLITSILTEMIVKNTIGDDTISTIIPQYIHDAVFIIENEYEKNITLKEVSLRIGVSKYYLSREFKLYIGKNFSDYLRWYRLEQAKKLLRERDFSVEQICYMCGMHTVSHFIKTFRIREGVTPLSYRKISRQWKTDH